MIERVSAFLLLVCSLAAGQTTPVWVAVRAGRLFTGADKLAMIQVVLIKGDRITEAGPVEKIKIPAGHAKSWLDAAFGELLRQVEYQARWSSKRFVQVGRFFPSTKLCSGCGYKNDSLSLSDREWTCPRCATHHIRDFNTAKNVTSEGPKIVAAGYRRR